MCEVYTFGPEKFKEYGIGMVFNFASTGLLKALKTVVLSVAVVTLIAGCSSDKKLKYQERTVTEIYDRALNYLYRGQYKYAAVVFDEVERQHPYSSWARRAQLMSSYAFFKARKYDESILAAQRFI